jgi:hypothetical protein
MTVAGFTMARTSTHRDHARESTTQNARSMGRRRGRRPTRSTASCCRSAKFSATRLARDRKAEASAPTIASTSASTAATLPQLGAPVSRESHLPIYNAMAMYRNYDGQGGQFGSYSVGTASPNAGVPASRSATLQPPNPRFESPRGSFETYSSPPQGQAEVAGALAVGAYAAAGLTLGASAYLLVLSPLRRNPANGARGMGVGVQYEGSF